MGLTGIFHYHYLYIRYLFSQSAYVRHLGRAFWEDIFRHNPFLVPQNEMQIQPDDNRDQEIICNLIVFIGVMIENF